MEQSKIPSAKDFFCQPRKYLFTDQIEEYKEIVEYAIFPAMVDFAKLHVEAALKAASEKVQLEVHTPISADLIAEVMNGEIIEIAKVNKDSILNAYPLDEIK